MAWHPTAAMPQQGQLLHLRLPKNNGKAQCKEQGLDMGRAIPGVTAGLRNANAPSR